MQVYSMSLSLLVWALINSGADTHLSNIKCNENHTFALQENLHTCIKGSGGLFIEDITFLRNSSYQKDSGKDSFLEKFFAAAIRRDCSRKLECNLTTSLKYLEKFKCNDVSLPISHITLVYLCKQFGVFDMCSPFETTVKHKHPTVLVLESQSNVKTVCRLKSHDDKSAISLRTLQVDFGSECDTSSDCQSQMEITLDRNNSKKTKLKSFDQKYRTFDGSNIDINIIMETGLVWLEVIAHSNYSINCRNNADLNDADSADGNKYIENESNGDVEEHDGDNGVGDNAFIIVLSVMAGIVTVILTCVWAVSVCRVHLGVGMIQRWLPFKPRTTPEHADSGHCPADMVNQVSTPSHVTKTSATTLITELDQVGCCEIFAVSRSSNHSHDVQVMLFPGTSRRSSSSQREDDPNPYSELEGNEMNIPVSDGTPSGKDKNPYTELEGNEINIPVSDGTLLGDDKNPCSELEEHKINIPVSDGTPSGDEKNPCSELEEHERNIPVSDGTPSGKDENPCTELEGNEMNIPGSDGTLNEAQTQELTNPPSMDVQGSGSPTHGTSGHSPTIKLKGSEFEDGAECLTTAALVESDYSLASKSDKKPSNSPNKV